MERTFNAKEVAELLHCHERTVKNRVRAGEWPGSKPGKKWVFTESDVAVMLETRRTTPTVVPSGSARQRRSRVA